MPSCCVPGCKSRGGREGSGLSFHLFPSSSSRRRQWAEIIRGPDVRWEPRRYNAVCSKHFQRKDFDLTSPLRVRLWQHAVPTIAVLNPPPSDEVVGQVTAPVSHTAIEHSYCNPDDSLLSLGESTDSADESIPEEVGLHSPSPIADCTAVSPFPEIVECDSSQQSPEQARPLCKLVNISGNGIGEYSIETNSSWDEYVERLETFCASISVSEDDEKRAVLLSFCGEATYRLITRLVEPNKPTTVSYETIKQAVRDHMHNKPSLLRARLLFYRRNQEPCESLADYVIALQKLAEDCGFGGKELPLDVMMRDRFVCGIRDEALQERLLGERDLTFQTAYNIAFKAEASREQQMETVWLSWNDNSNRDNSSLVYTSKNKQQIILPPVVMATTHDKQTKLTWRAVTSNEKGVLLVKPV
ncbi:uncharacterized protein [Dermacentor andersoni]|uniref:uncharacterized protein n=1 Tax=Dermacentor andersoni TaxID=34620 RepID=UPI0021554E80|nr:uncharacterized protein LOC126525592 [Dermacentor andersoni]